MIAVAFTTADAVLLVVVVVLIFLSAAIAVAETAITRISRSRAAALEEQGHKRAAMVVAIVGNFERSLNAIYLVALALQTVQASITGIVASRVFGTAGVIVATLINVVVVFIIAEAAPKTWALQHTDRAALATAPLIVLIGRMFRWIADVLITVTNVILPGKGLEQGPFVTEEEIIALMGEAAEASVIEEEERDLIESIIDFGDTVAREIMVPRTDMVSFEVEYRVADCVEIAILNGLSRFPVYRENIDDIVGIVYAKDLMRAERDQRGTETIEGLMRPPQLIPETKRVAELLREMQSRQTHIAIVVDEYGGTAGVVTLEDLVEEIVGEVLDEHDRSRAGVVRTAASLTFPGDLRPDELLDRAGVRVPEGEVYDTVGGFLMAELERIPKVGDTVEVEDGLLTVHRMDGRRVDRVQFTPTPTEENVADLVRAAQGGDQR